MNRNQYDTDVTVWSPQGRLFQVEYAMEAVRQGSACVGAVSKKFAVLAALKRNTNELSDYQKKVFKIDDNMGIVISGLTADARTLFRLMRTECLNHKFVYGSHMNTGGLVREIADRHQRCTQSYVRRPYGVGLLVAGYDKPSGAHLYRTCPSGNFYEYKGYAIGARSQSARTYLEKNFETFPDADKDTLIKHALTALSGCTDSGKELSTLNASVAIVGEDTPFTIIDGDDIAPYLAAVLGDDAGAGEGEGAGAGAGAASGAGADPDDDEDM